MHAIDMQIGEGEALVARNALGSPEFARGLELLQRHAEAGAGTAQLVLGHVYSQFHALPDADAQAASWYRRAAEQGHPAAQDRLADLYMAGRGLPQDDAEAFHWYRRTAEQAYPVAQCNLAYMLAEGIGAEVDETAATGWYLRAAAQGDARAYYNLGLRYLAGAGTAADPIQAWAWLSNAARRAYPGSTAELEAIGGGLDAAGASEARALAGRIAANFETLERMMRELPQLQATAETYRRAVEGNFEALGVPAFSLEASRRSAGGVSSRHRQGEKSTVASASRVFTVADFISRGEAAHLMSLASPKLKPALKATRDLLSGEQTAFTGEVATFQSTLCDPVVRNLERRIAAAFALPPTHVEPVSVIRYQKDHHYAAHVDYFGPERLAHNRSIGDLAGQRLASFLVYLQAPLEGGETHYLKLGAKVAGRDRMALCHFNCLPDGGLDEATLHTGEPVMRGEKWLARTTLREKPFY